MTDKKYLKKMDWSPSVIYYIKAFSRNEKYPPRVWENKGQYGPFFTTDVKVARYNTIDKKYTEIGDYQFRIAHSILDEVKNYVEKDMPFYLRKTAGFNDKGKAINIYKIYSNPNEIKEVQQDMVSEKEVKPIKQKIQQNGDIAYILEFVSNIDNTLNMILNTILEWRKDK